jgi:hypothetical protein
LTFDLTSSANNPHIIPPLPSCIPAGTGAAESFALLSGCTSGSWTGLSDVGVFAIGIPPVGSCCPSPPQFAIADDLGPSPFPNPDSGFGSYSISAVATPEPSSLALMLSGVGLVFAMRKRSSGLQQAS